MKLKIAVIGCGVIGGGFAKHFSSSHELTLFDKDRQLTEQLALELGKSVCVAGDINEAIADKDVIFLAIKPQSLRDLKESLTRLLHSEQLLISTLAGVSLEKLEESFVGVPILRVMPNIACFYGQGVVSLVESITLSEKHRKYAENIFSGLGMTSWIPESQVDALTALTGSGPAFLFVLIESMVDAGVSMGLKFSEAQDLVLQTIIGAATIVKETGKHPGELKWQVSSPGGTTIAGLREMEDRAVRSGMMEAILAAYRRACGL